MSDTRVSKRKTEPKAPKKKASKEVASPRKKTKSNKRKSANIPELVVEEKKNRTIRASIATPSDIQPIDAKLKSETDEEFEKFQEDYTKKAQAKREENEKKANKKNKEDNGNKSPRVKKDPESKGSKKSKEKEADKNKDKVEKTPRLSDSDSDTQDTLASMMASLDRDKELVVPSILSKLSELLSNPKFATDFINSQGFEKLSMHLVKITDTDSLVLILSFLEKAFRDCPGVFEHLFAESAVMVTTLIWLLVKVKKSDFIVTAKVYLLLASLPVIAYEKKFPEIEIHNLIFSALNLYHQKADERLRFQNLVKAFQTNSQELKLAVLKLTNTLIEMYQSVEGRMGMRLEFISLGLEEAMIKSYEESEQEIREEISRYDNLRTKDTESYKQLHANLISPAWVEGKDLQSLANTLITRWASLPNLQSVVVATLCSLLHISNDENVGTAKWFFFNKVVNQVIDGDQEKMTLEGCDKIDLNKMVNQLQGITMAEKVLFKKELADEKWRSQQQAERIQSLETQIRQFTEKTFRSSDQNTELANLNKTLAETTAKLSETEKKLITETESTYQLQNNLKEFQNKFEILERQEKENLAQIKSLQQKLEELEKILQTKQTRSSVEDRTSTVGSPDPIDISLPIQMTDHSSGIDLDKEEQRMYRAMSKFGGQSSWRNPISPAITPRLDLEGPPSPNGLNSPQKAPSTRTISPRPVDTSIPPLGGEIPEWKKRQLEKERIAQEKFDREQQKKLELFSSTSSSETTIPVPLVQLNPPEVGAVVEVDEEHLVKPGSELSLAEREEIRLARALNRPRGGGRTSQIHT